MAANSRSVPTAFTGEIPNTNTRIGVISEPPPTPVSPTRKPTKNPEKVYAKSTGYVRGTLNAYFIKASIAGKNNIMFYE